MARGTPHFAKYFDERETRLPQQYSLFTGATVPRDGYTAHRRPLSKREDDDPGGQVEHHDRLQRDGQARPFRGRNVSPRPSRHIPPDTTLTRRGPQADVRCSPNVQDRRRRISTVPHEDTNDLTSSMRKPDNEPEPENLSDLEATVASREIRVTELWRPPDE